MVLDLSPLVEHRREIELVPVFSKKVLIFSLPQRKIPPVFLENAIPAVALTFMLSNVASSTLTTKMTVMRISSKI